jgi:hypothetical protein
MLKAGNLELNEFLKEHVQGCNGDAVLPTDFDRSQPPSTDQAINDGNGNMQIRSGFLWRHRRRGESRDHGSVEILVLRGEGSSVPS